MRDSILVKRYAQAFVEFASDTIGIQQVVDECKALRGIIFDNPDFFDFLKTPEVMFSEKKELIEKVLRDIFSKEIKEFLYLLLEKHRIQLLVDVADYIRIHYAYGEAQEALLKTSYPLELELIEEIKKKMENRIGKKLNFYLELDPELLGGIQVVVGNTVFDGSVQKRLTDLKEKLEGTLVG